MYWRTKLEFSFLFQTRPGVGSRLGHRGGTGLRRTRWMNRGVPFISLILFTSVGRVLILLLSDFRKKEDNGDLEETTASAPMHGRESYSTATCGKEQIGYVFNLFFLLCISWYIFSTSNCLSFQKSVKKNMIC